VDGTTHTEKITAGFGIAVPFRATQRGAEMLPALSTRAGEQEVPSQLGVDLARQLVVGACVGVRERPHERRSGGGVVANPGG